MEPIWAIALIVATPKGDSEMGASQRLETALASPVLAVLDIETAVDRVAAADVPPRHGDPIKRRALHRIAAASVLLARRGGDGAPALELRTWCAPDEEPAILEGIDAALSATGPTGGLLTFFGSRHDLGIVRRRAARHLMFDLRAVARWTDDAQGHADVALAGTGIGRAVPSLADACAGLSIRLDHAPVPPHGPALPGPARKCQVDVVATYLLAHYEAAMRSGSLTELEAAWTAVAALAAGLAPNAPHLDTFLTHPVALICAERRRARSVVA